MEAHRLAAAKKDAARLGAYVVFIDESGFLLIPPVRRTWAPRGQRPRIAHHQRRDRISIISALSISPKRKRLGLYFQMHEKNIQHAEVCDVLRHLLRHLRGHIIVLWDGAKIHKGDPIRQLCRRFRRLHLEPLPAYGPVLNPDERVSSQAKQPLADGRPDTLDDLLFDLWLTLHGIRLSQRKLRACVDEFARAPFLHEASHYLCRCIQSPFTCQAQRWERPGRDLST